jgi:hypothetical protein
VYFAFTTYGAFAVREFIGHDLFDTLLTENPTRWPWHAWINFPLVPLSLIASRTPIVLWTTSPLVPLLFSWPSTVPVNATAAAVAAGAARRLAVRPQLWPPPPVLVCALFPSIRAIYTRLRERVTNALVTPRPRTRRVPPPAPPPQRPQQQQQQQQEQQQQENGGPQRFGLQIREHFDLEIRAHIRVGPAANGNHDDAPVQEQEQQPEPQPEPEPAQQPQPPQQQQQQQRADAPAPAPPPAPAAPMNDEDFAAAAARTLRVTTASFGRLIGGALAMPTIARMMGFALLRLSHVLPLVRVIIAPRQQPPPQMPVPAAAAVGLMGLWNNLQRSRLFGGDGWREDRRQVVLGNGSGSGNGNGTALGGKVLSGLFLTTSQEWAMSDPVWYV